MRERDLPGAFGQRRPRWDLVSLELQPLGFRVPHLGPALRLMQFGSRIWSRTPGPVSGHMTSLITPTQMDGPIRAVRAVRAAQSVTT